MKRLTDEEIAELERLGGWPRPWRTDASTEGEESDVVADNMAYPDEIAHLAEFSDERDARLAVSAVNALPGLLAEVRASRASPSAPIREALRELVSACEPDGTHPAHPWMRYTAALAAARAALRLLGGADGGVSVWLDGRTGEVIATKGDVTIDGGADGKEGT